MFDGLDSLGTDFDPTLFGDFHPNTPSNPQASKDTPPAQPQTGMGQDVTGVGPPMPADVQKQFWQGSQQKSATMDQVVPIGIAAGTGMVGKAIAGHYAVQSAEILGQIANIKSQRAANNAMFNAQLNALRATPEYRQSFLAQYGVLLIVGGVALAGLMFYLMQRKKR